MSTNPRPVDRRPLKANQLISLDDVRNQLAKIWLIGSGLVFLLLVVQSLLHAYGDLTQDVWGWFLPTLLPTLGLIVTVLTYTALDPLATGSVVRRSFHTNGRVAIDRIFDYSSSDHSDPAFRVTDPNGGGRTHEDL